MEGFGTSDPGVYEIGAIRVQAGKATPSDDEGADWYELHSEKRAKIEFKPDPKMRGKDPVMRVNYGSQTGTIDCAGVESAITLYKVLMIEMTKLLGTEPGELFAVASTATDDRVTFRTSDPHRLVRTIRRLKEKDYLVVPD